MWDVSFDSNLDFQGKSLDKFLPCGNDETYLIGRGIVCARANY